MRRRSSLRLRSSPSLVACPPSCLQRVCCVPLVPVVFPRFDARPRIRMRLQSLRETPPKKLRGGTQSSERAPHLPPPWKSRNTHTRTSTSEPLTSPTLVHLEAERRHSQLTRLCSAEHAPSQASAGPTRIPRTQAAACAHRVGVSKVETDVVEWSASRDCCSALPWHPGRRARRLAGLVTMVMVNHG